MDALRSALQPVTHNIPAPIRDIGLSLLGPACYQTLIHDIDLSNPQCIKLAISKGLGIGIIGASSIVKIPQLLKLLNSRSSEGISFLSYLLETASYLISLAYNVRNGFPFSTFGETALIAVQNVAIATLVLQYGGRTAGAAVFVAGLAAAGYALFNRDAVSMKTLSVLQAGAGVLGVASKAPQIWTVWRQGGTGQLSAFAVCSASVLCQSREKKDRRLTRCAGLQLPSGFSLPHFHDVAGSSGPADLVWLRGWVCTQCCSCGADAVLLEQPRQQGHSGYED